jgi:hypothetical protein
MNSYAVGYNLVLKTAELDAVVPAPAPAVVTPPTPQPLAPVYHYAPPASVDSIMTHGLAGNKGLVANPELLKAVALAKGTRTGRLLSAIQGTQAGYEKDVFEGPNVMFSDIPDTVQLADAHPLRQNDYAKIQVDMDALMRDEPETRAFGIELTPDGRGDTRRRFLEDAELRELQARTPEELWKHYEDPDNEGYYAANVPHASIHTPTGIIAPKYLKVM